jgi:hypothetical protein
MTDAAVDQPRPVDGGGRLRWDWLLTTGGIVLMLTLLWFVAQLPHQTGPPVVGWMLTALAATLPSIGCVRALKNLPRPALPRGRARLATACHRAEPGCGSSGCPRRTS